MRGLPWVVAVLVVVLGCSGDSQGPSDRTLSVQGDWLLSFTLSDANYGVVCSMSNIPITLEQHDTAFAGTFGDAEQQCTSPDGPTTSTLPAGQIFDGTVHGTTVAFRFHLYKWYQQGSGDSTSLSGTAVWEIPTSVYGFTVTRTGNWTAVRPPKP